MKNIEQINAAKSVQITTILASIGLEFQKTGNGGELIYLSPLHGERTPSFFVNQPMNVFNDFGNGEKGDSIRLVRLLFKLSFPESVDWLNRFSGKDVNFQMPELKEAKKNNLQIIKKMQTVESNYLLSYALKRGITAETLRNCENIEQIFYKNGLCTYTSIGFKNDLGGYELRNENFKGCLGKKTITTINGGFKIGRIFEGFFNYLSFIELFGLCKFHTYIILNSTNFAAKCPPFEFAYCYLDNDQSGKMAYEKIKEKTIVKVYNESKKIFPNHNDLNEFHVWQKA